MTTPVLLGDSLFIATAPHCYEKVAQMDIFYIQAEKTCVHIITAQKMYCLSTNLGGIAPQLDPERFGRVSRSHIVNWHQIDRIQPHELLVAGVPIPIGKQYREGILERLPILRTKYGRATSDVALT